MKRIKHKGFIILCILIILYTLVFTYLSLLRYRSFFSYEWEEEAGRNQIAWNTAHGRLFYQTIERNNSRDGIFRDHFEPIFLLIALFYLIVPHITTIYFLRSLIFALGALPIYWLAKETTKTQYIALIFSLTYLLYSPLHYLNLSVFKPINLSVTFLLCAFYFFQKNKFGKFLIFSILTLSCNELLSFTILVFGIYALIRRKSMKWIIVPLVLGVVYYFVAFNMIMQRVSYLNHLVFDEGPGGGGGIIGVIKYVLFNPVDTYRQIHFDYKVSYLSKIFKPLLFFSFLSPAILLIAVAPILQVLLYLYRLGNQSAHWISNIIPFAIIAALYGYIKICKFIYSLKKVNPSVKRLISDLVLFSIFISSLISNFTPNIIAEPNNDYINDRRFLEVDNIFDKKLYTMDESDKVAWEMIRQIPPNASVSASGDLLTPLSHRHILREYPDDLTDYLDVDYILVHTKIIYNGAGHYNWFSQDDHENKEILLDKIRQLLDSKRWILIANKQDFFLLKRIYIEN